MWYQYSYDAKVTEQHDTRLPTLQRIRRNGSLEWHAPSSGPRLGRLICWWVRLVFPPLGGANAQSYSNPKVVEIIRFTIS